MTLAGILAAARSEEPPSEREAHAAVVIAGALYFVGALLCATAVLLPHVSAPAGVLAVALAAMGSAWLLLIAAARGRGGLRLALIADLWGVALIAVLCASSGATDSPFALIYFFALGHAAAYQPRRRVALVAVAGLLAFLSPLVYAAHVPTSFGAVACVGIVLALLASLVVHFSLNRLRAQRRRLRLLIDATAELDRSLDPAQTLRTVAHMAVPDLAGLCAIDLAVPDSPTGRTVAAAEEPALQEQARHLREHAGDLTGGRADGARDSHTAVFAMVARGRTLGTICFMHVRGDVLGDAGLLAVLEDLAGRAAMALDNARLYAERAQVARTLRHSLMPAVLPRIPGLDLATYFRPSGVRSEVGGDFYDAFQDRESCWLIVGDVCGKGAEAAALTAFMRHTAAAYAREGSSPGRVLEQVNRAMLDRDFDGRFATAVLARVRAHEDGAELTLALAGHPAALLIRAGSAGVGVGELGGGGALLGVFAEASIEEVAAVLEPGDSLVMYTDGLSEAHAPERVLSAQEMIAQLEHAAPASAGETIDSLLALIGPGPGVRDDIAILSAQVTARGDSAGAGASSRRPRFAGRATLGAERTLGA